MATMVNRKVWFLESCAISSGVVTHQNFDPDFLMVKPDNSRFDVTLSPYRVFLKPQDAIKDAREFAALLLDNAKKLEESLDA